MTGPEKLELLEKAGDFFRNNIVKAHLKNLKKLKKYKKFNVNPFLNLYLSYFLTGKGDAEGVARALLYPRILGTSINTSFGTHIQRFCTEVLGAHGSIVGGLDIEFVDQIDSRRKYCQIKSGPQTVNKDDVQTVKNKFRHMSALARTNSVDIGIQDFVVAVLYGTEDSLSAFYREIKEDLQS